MNDKLRELEQDSITSNQKIKALNAKIQTYE